MNEKIDSSRQRLLAAQERAMDANLAAEELKELLAVVKVHKPIHSGEARTYVVHTIENLLDKVQREANARVEEVKRIEFWGRR